MQFEIIIHVFTGAMGDSKCLAMYLTLISEWVDSGCQLFISTLLSSRAKAGFTTWPPAASIEQFEKSLVVNGIELNQLHM